MVGNLVSAANMDKDINITNILVSSETQILTKDIGYVPIHQIFNTPTKVWAGEDWVETSARKFNSNCNLLLHLNFNQRYFLNVSESFNFIVLNDEDEEIVKEAKDLEFGDYIIPFRAPTGTITRTYSHIKLCSKNKLSNKDNLYHLDYSNSDRFLMNGVLTGIS